jgi:hypothetical protein
MATTPAPAEPASIGTMGRLTGVLFSPKETLADIARHPSWIAPLVLLCLVNLAIIAIFTQRVGWVSFMQKKIDESSQAQQLSPEQRQQRVEVGARVAPYTGAIFGVLGIVVVTLIVAGVLLGAFNAMASANLNFKAAMGITAHALMPGFIGGLLGILILFLKDPTTIDIEHLVAANLGALVPDGSAKWLVTLASSFDLFTFWVIALLAIGFSVANPKKITMGRAFGVVIALWTVIVIIRVGIAAAFS